MKLFNDKEIDILYTKWFGGGYFEIPGKMLFRGDI